LGVVDLVWDRTRRSVVSCKGRLVETVVADIPLDSIVAARVAGLEASVDSGLSEVIGTLEVAWKRAPGPKESNVGSWQADALREYAKADVAFQNSGGIRKDLPAGPITLRDMWEISPFGNEVVVFEVTGEQLLTMLAFQGLKEQEFCQVSGVRYTYDRTKPPEKALTATVGGEPVEPGKRYRVVTNSYVGGHLHDIFNLPENEIRVEPLMPPVSDRDVFIEAVRREGTIRSQVDGRIRVIREKDE
ncbi:MAG: 5'-nucleotidase, partial [Bacteroidota bacterium]|nr:5'-nucleotidase [Bacteroidota bacterium]